MGRTAARPSRRAALAALLGLAALLAGSGAALAAGTDLGLGFAATCASPGPVDQAIAWAHCQADASLSAAGRVLCLSFHPFACGGT
jgi:hypothetical protein